MAQHDQPSRIVQALSGSYSLSSHCTKDGNTLIDYEPSKLSSFRVFGAVSGTVLENPILFTEQLMLTLLFFAVAAPVYYFFNQDVATESPGAPSVNKWLDSQEAKMRAFSTIVTTLAAFLLSFYTSIAVSRWWTIRTSGIGAIRSAAIDLEMFVQQLVTKEEQVLSAIRRYARASLMLVFLWRRNELNEMKTSLVASGVLTAEEAEKLQVWNHSLHETIWAWQTAIIAVLHAEGRVDSEPLLCLLLGRCSKGRAGAQVIATHLTVKVPMVYVHLLGLLVKVHNIVVAVLMGLLFGAAVRDGNTIICLQLFGRTCLLPLLFNAILLINAELSDPFDEFGAGFPGSRYDAALERDGAATVQAGKSLPKWLLDRDQGLSVN